MDNWILILLLVFTFTAGYFAVRNLGRFPENDLRRPEDEIRRNVRKLHIAAEVPAMLDAVSPALSVYSDTDPFVEFFLGQASGQTLLQRLSQALWTSSCWRRIRHPTCPPDVPRCESPGLCPPAAAQPRVFLWSVWRKTRPSARCGAVRFPIKTGTGSCFSWKIWNNSGSCDIIPQKGW